MLLCFYGRATLTKRGRSISFSHSFCYSFKNLTTEQTLGRLANSKWTDLVTYSDEAFLFQVFISYPDNKWIKEINKEFNIQTGKGDETTTSSTSSEVGLTDTTSKEGSQKTDGGELKRGKGGGATMGFGGTLWRTKKTYERLKILHGSMRNSLKHKTVVQRNKTWHGMIKDEAQESLKKLKKQETPRRGQTQKNWKQKRKRREMT